MMVKYKLNCTRGHDQKLKVNLISVDGGWEGDSDRNPFSVNCNGRPPGARNCVSICGTVSGE